MMPASLRCDCSGAIIPCAAGITKFSVDSLSCKAIVPESLVRIKCIYLNYVHWVLQRPQFSLFSLSGGPSVVDAYLNSGPKLRQDMTDQEKKKKDGLCQVEQDLSMGTGNSGSGVGIKTSEKQLALWGWRECERGKMGEGTPGETTLPVYQGKDFRSGGRSGFCHSLFRLQCPLNCY